MSKVGVLMAVVLAGSMLGRFGTTSRATQGSYKAWVACSLSKQAPASHSCRKGSDKAAFFKSIDATVRYKVCVRYPTGTRLCATHQPAPKGKVHANTISSTLIGEHRVTWSVAGKQVSAWTFQVKA